MIALSIQSPLPPDETLAALRQRMALWRESELPAELRRAGIIAVSTRVRGHTCIAEYDRKWYGPADRAMRLRLRASVTAMPNEETRVEARVSYEAPLALALGLVAIVSPALALLVLTMHVWPVLALVLVAAVASAVVRHAANTRLSRQSEPAAEFLIGRLETALAGAPQLT